MGIGASWSGRDLDVVAGDLQAVGELAVEAATIDAADTMRGRVHVLTGRTKGSIHVVPGDDPLHGQVEAGFGAYAEEFENDTQWPRKAPHEFAQPSLDEVGPRMMELLEQLVKDALNG